MTSNTGKTSNTGNACTAAGIAAHDGTNSGSGTVDNFCRRDDDIGAQMPGTPKARRSRSLITCRSRPLTEPTIVKEWPWPAGTSSSAVRRPMASIALVRPGGPEANQIAMTPLSADRRSSSPGR